MHESSLVQYNGAFVQSKINAFITESAWTLLFEPKFKRLSSRSNVVQKTVTYVELYSKKDCEELLRHGEYSGGFFISDEEMTTFVCPKAYIRFRNSEERRIGYVEEIVENIAKIYVPRVGIVELEVPSLLNRPYNCIPEPDNNDQMILLEIVPVRLKFSRTTLKLSVVFHRIGRINYHQFIYCFIIIFFL